jgi:hypothetical protein
MTTCWNCGNQSTGNFCSLCGSSLSLAVQHSQTRIINHPTAATSVRSVQTALQDIGHGNVTNRANAIQGSSDESMVWEDSPSLALLIGPIVKYFIVTVVAVAIASNIPSENAWCLPASCFAFLGLRLLYRFCDLRSTKYRMSSQRLVIDSGVFTRVSVPHEVHLLSDAVVHSPLLLRLFGRGNLTIVDQRISLRAIRNPEAIRDLLRNAGQWEAARLDKIRWR